jgi:hypothetical protein
VTRKLALLALLAWLGAGTALGGVLLLRHVAALPTPALGDPTLSAAFAEVLPPSGDRLRAIHVMYRSCPCSRRTIAHLLERRALPETDELVVMVDDDGRPGEADAALRTAGFRVRVTTPRELHERFALEAAPVLVVARSDGALAYVGGYNRRKQAPYYEDAAILAELALRPTAAARPVFGCPTSARLAEALDPLGLQPRAPADTKGTAR